MGNENILVKSLPHQVKSMTLVILVSGTLKNSSSVCRQLCVYLHTSNTSRPVHESMCQ